PPLRPEPGDEPRGLGDEPPLGPALAQLAGQERRLVDLQGRLGGPSGHPPGLEPGRPLQLQPALGPQLLAPPSEGRRSLDPETALGPPLLLPPRVRGRPIDPQTPLRTPLPGPARDEGRLPI